LTENRPEAGAVALKIGERGMALGRSAAGKLLVTPERAGEALEAIHSLLVDQASSPSDASSRSEDSSTNSECDAVTKSSARPFRPRPALTSS
jgi:hypothetical protein